MAEYEREEFARMPLKKKTGKLGCVMGYDPAGYDFSCNLYHLSNV